MSEGTDTEEVDLLGTGTWIRQGPATLVIRENAWVVLVPGLRRQVTEAAWTVLGETPAPEEFLERFVAAAELESADKLAALLFGFHDGTRAVFGVKGTTPIAVYTAEGSQQIAGTEDEPFVMKTLEGVRRVAFGDLPAEDAVGAARLSAGVVPVRGFVHVTSDPAELDESERAALAEQVEADGRSIEDPEAKQRRAARPAPTPAPTSTAGAPSVRKPAMAERKPGEMPPSLSRASARPNTSSRSSSGAEPEPSGPNLFAGLFGDSSPAPAAAVAAAQAAPAAAPEQRPSPRTEPAPEPAPAGSRPEPTASPAPAAAPAAPASASAGPASASTSPAPSASADDRANGEDAAQTSSAGRRRLVSTSLFDRRRRSPAKAPTPAPVASAQTPTPAPAPEVPAPVPSASLATPAPPDDDEFDSSAIQTDPVDDDLVSPVTQVAPIDDEGVPHDERVLAPRQAPAPPRDAAPASASSDLENTGAYDDLFGKTVFRRVEDAAVRRAEEDEEAVDDEAVEQTSAVPSAPAAPEISASPTSAVSAASAEPVPEPDPRSGSSSASSEFIDWVPGVGRTAPEIAQTAARRASAQHPPEPAYSQVHMAERPPAPNTGSRPAPTRPPAPSAPPAPHGRSAPYGPAAPYERPAPYEQAGPYPPSGGPVAAAAGQQVGYPGAPGQPQQYSQGPADPAAAGHQLGLSGPQRSGAPGHPPQEGMPPRQGTHSSRYLPANASPSGQHTGSPQAAPPQNAGHGSGHAVTLPGLVCANGHANSPERAACRVCGAPLHGPTRTVARPPLGAITISGGERFLLDRTAIIGRRPRASRVSAQDVPQLITVPSPQQDISRSHLELRLEGWHVVALDLGTTNGTTLYREGFEPLRLRPREGMVLHHGDHLDLGDDVHLMFGERA